MTAAELRTDALIVICAISAGIHAALAPDHFLETTGAGVGFVAATVLLAVLAVVLTRQPSQAAFAAAAALFAGLIGSYGLAVTTGIPVIHPDVDPLEGLALATKAIEAVGLALAAWALPWSRLQLTLEHAKGTFT